MPELGLFLIISGWLYQLIQKTNKVEPLFVGLYIVGVMFLIIDGYKEGLLILAFLNLISLALATTLLYRLTKK